MKKVISAVLSALTVLSVTATASAETAPGGTLEGTKLKWQIKSKVLYINGSGAIPDYEISASQPWANFYEQYKTVSLSEGVTAVGKNAFASNTNLTSIRFAEDGRLKRIGDHAFSGDTGLTKLTLPDTVKTIEANAFEGCSNVKTITSSAPAAVGEYAFNSCSALKKITLSKAVSLAQYSLANCPELTTIDAPYAKFDKYVFMNGSKVTAVNAGTLADEAFYGCAALKKVSLKKAGKIGNKAMAYCTGITEISSDAVTVGKEAFLGCTNLSYVKLPKAKRISESAFAQLPKLKTVKLGSAESIGKTAFYDCPKLKTVTGTEKVKTIASYAFSYDNKMTKFPSSKSLTYVGARAFFDCRNMKGSFDAENITQVGEFAFGNCRKLSSSFNFTKVKKIGKGAFSYCLKLKSNSLGQKLKTAGSFAFAGCKSIKHIYVPPVCKKLGFGCFAKAKKFIYTNDGGYTFTPHYNEEFIIYGKRFSYAEKYAYSKYVECKFRVAVEKIKPDKKSIKLKKGKSHQIKATTSPSNARYNTLKYKSSNSKIATVNSSGYVTACQEGDCVITLMSVDGSQVTATVKVKVE